MDMLALRDYFNAAGASPQKLGYLDCVRFVTEAVYVGWGRDYRDILQYNDRKTAVARLRELGGLRGACSFAMGQMHPLKDLEPGDVIYWHEPRPTIGLLMSNMVLIKMGNTIQRFVPQEEWMGWKTEQSRSTS